MHAVGTTRDVRTVIHEAGHAMHNMMERDEPIINYLIKPSEIAELASMGMELISLDHWSEFYSEDILKIVKRNELLDKIKFIPWGVVVDAFQHWIYLNPAHTAKERSIYFSKLLKQYKIGGNWDGLEKEKAIRWMMQLHIFEMPFYYIEYVLAQLGAVAIYCNYKKNPQKTVEQYKNFLKAAYSKPVSQIYKTAGIDFDFSEKYILKLLNFIRKELERG
jgi:oligoendopeptidase F